MSLACDTESGQAKWDVANKTSEVFAYPPPQVDTSWQKRQYREIALQAALKLSSVAEPEKRVIERARVIFDFLYGEEAK